MTGPRRAPPGDPAPGEDAQYGETAGDPLDWQGELDVAIADIDSRLKHPRRRATDIQPAASPSGITSEAIDEIAWRVAELLRRDGSAPASAGDVASAISTAVAGPKPAGAAPSRAAARPVPPPLPEPRRLPHGIAMTIRIRKPFFRLPWPFRRRRQAMMMFSDYRIS
jgi:hypothetical protein